MTKRVFAKDWTYCTAQVTIEYKKGQSPVREESAKAAEDAGVLVDATAPATDRK
ncbi:MAG: hypothetical protein ABW043_16720 [Devosia sp.]|uniref:hypothetical protein n=1 Tax=Devosia sp. TaxID=1871048 RepID=UPI00339184FB